MKLRTGLDLLALLAGLALTSCMPDSKLAETRIPAPLVTSVTVPSITESGPHNPTPTIPPDQQPASAFSKAQQEVVSTPIPIQVELPLIQNSSQAEVCSPLAGIDLVEVPDIISSPYDPPPPGKEDRHHGIDFAYYRRGEQLSIQGTGVQALLPGVVAMALEDSFPYGNVIIVESNLATVPTISLNLLDVREGESLYTLYAHLETIPQVLAGQGVAACQLLGVVGKSGNAGVAHLHLETRLGPAGIEFDRMGYYLAESTQLEKENYLRWRISGEFRHFNPLTLLAPKVIP
jgi:murein DD-endopeptidase MepM/ murein hydrolase activator NlpD